MKIRTALVSAASLLLAGCYNNPETTMKHPGDGPQNHMSRPSVGPGTTNGGSTAGPQPPARNHEKAGHTEPMPSGAPHGDPSHEVAKPAAPEMQGHGQTQSGPVSRQGNEKGVGQRGPGSH